MVEAAVFEDVNLAEMVNLVVNTIAHYSCNESFLDEMIFSGHAYTLKEAFLVIVSQIPKPA